MKINYLQHNLLTNITQDAFTRYVGLFPVTYQRIPNLQWTDRNHLLAAQPSHQHHARCLYEVDHRVEVNSLLLFVILDIF
jgi:hypothetical protein